MTREIGRFEDSLCPGCGKNLGMATAVDGEIVDPKDGDVSVCLYCSQICIFVVANDKTTFRAATEKEEDALTSKHPEMARAIQVVELARRRLK